MSNRLSISSKLEDISNSLGTALTFVDDKINLTINNKEFSFSKTTTLGSMLNQISSDSSSNINMRYDEINDTIKITSKVFGEGSNIKISETGSIF